VIRNIVAATPSSLKLSATEALSAIDPANAIWACRFAMQKDLNRLLRCTDAQGSDVEIWKNDNECMEQSIDRRIPGCTEPNTRPVDEMVLKQ
jgi:hypothetical protein